MTVIEMTQRSVICTFAENTAPVHYILSLRETGIRADAVPLSGSEAQQSVNLFRTVQEDAFGRLVARAHQLMDVSMR